MIKFSVKVPGKGGILFARGDNSNISNISTPLEISLATPGLCTLFKTRCLKNFLLTFKVFYFSCLLLPQKYFFPEA